MLGGVKIKSFTMTQQSFKSTILNDQGVKLVMFDKFFSIQSSSGQVSSVYFGELKDNSGLL